MDNTEVRVTILYVPEGPNDVAIKVASAGGRQAWLPIRLLKGGPEPCDWAEGMTATFTIPTWLAEKKKLV